MIRVAYKNLKSETLNCFICRLTLIVNRSGTFTCYSSVCILPNTPVNSVTTCIKLFTVAINWAICHDFKYILRHKEYFNRRDKVIVKHSFIKLESWAGHQYRLDWQCLGEGFVVTKALYSIGALSRELPPCKRSSLTRTGYHLTRAKKDAKENSWRHCYSQHISAGQIIDVIKNQNLQALLPHCQGSTLLPVMRTGYLSEQRSCLFFLGWACQKTLICIEAIQIQQS